MVFLTGNSARSKQAKIAKPCPKMSPESRTAKHMAPGEADQTAWSSPGTTACRCAVTSVFLLLEKTVRTS